MLKSENECITYNGGGLFLTDHQWIHPEKTEKTYEIIYVVKGNVYLEENGNTFELNPGDLRVLLPNVMHRGTKISETATSFYWHHFFLSDELGFPSNYIFKNISYNHIFTEILHLENLLGKTAAEPALLHLLTMLRNESLDYSANSHLANRVHEWVRTNADATLTVKKTAEFFGYNPEYLSKTIRKVYGNGLKNIVNEFVIMRANNLLDNSTYSVKEISSILKFVNANHFVNFYKYHTKTTPSTYRKRIYKTWLNSE